MIHFLQKNKSVFKNLNSFFDISLPIHINVTRGIFINSKLNGTSCCALPPQNQEDRQSFNEDPRNDLQKPDTISGEELEDINQDLDELEEEGLIILDPSLSNESDAAFKERIENIPDTEAAWLAGLLQGEAHFGIDDRRKGKKQNPDYKFAPAAPFYKLDMIDRDVVAKVGSIFNGTMTVLKRRTKARKPKPVYRARLDARAKVDALTKRIMPFLVGERITDKAQGFLDLGKEHAEWVKGNHKSIQAKAAAKASNEAKAAKKKALKEKEQGPETEKAAEVESTAKPKKSRKTVKVEESENVDLN